MCGIMGYVGNQQAWPVVISGLKRLEYRGYDSAGVATTIGNKVKAAKRVGHLSSLLRSFPEGLPGATGIGHTRWATHGGVTENNSHPHMDNRDSIAIVHNGIIDNADVLRERLIKEGCVFRSETDSEVLSHLAATHLAKGATTLLDAIRATLLDIEGTAGILAIWDKTPDRIVAARIGSPVVLGLADDETFIASDPNALVGHTKRIVYLDDGEIADITATGFQTFDLQNQPRKKLEEEINIDPGDMELNGFPHFMVKEISEQPEAVDRTIRGRVDTTSGNSRLGGLLVLEEQLHSIKRCVFFGCGTSLHAAQVGRYIFERYARVPATAEDAAELRTRNPIINTDTLYVAISQSGETADTLTTLKEIKMRGGLVAGITNVVGSSLARETMCGVHIHAGPEISVASTKAFTSQVTALTLMGLHFARMRDLPEEMGRDWVKAFDDLPGQIQTVLKHAEMIRDLASTFKDAKYAMFVGRGISHSVGREGALKLKEIAYIPCDGLSGAEMKHGSLALIEPGTPVWTLVPPDETRERMVGNLQELKARGACILAVAAEDDIEVRRLADAFIPLPSHHPAFSPALTVIPLQLFAYYAAYALDHNVDRPRNLAKSVTVE